MRSTDEQTALRDALEYLQGDVLRAVRPHWAAIGPRNVLHALIEALGSIGHAVLTDQPELRPELLAKIDVLKVALEGCGEGRTH